MDVGVGANRQDCDVTEHVSPFGVTAFDAVQDSFESGSGDMSPELNAAGDDITALFAFALWHRCDARDFKLRGYQCDLVWQISDVPGRYLTHSTLRTETKHGGGLSAYVCHGCSNLVL